MKKLYVLLLTLLVFSCKHDFEPALVIDRKFAIKEFTIPGVKSEDIQFKENLIIINLPADYAKGDFIKPVIKLSSGFKLQNPIDAGFTFQGQNIDFAVKSDWYGEMYYKIIVVPATSLEIPVNNKAYPVTVQYNSLLNIPIDNLGTMNSVDEAGALVFIPKVTLTDKTTGAAGPECAADFSMDSTSRWFLQIKFPVTASAGLYNATIEWGTRKVNLPDPFELKYGTPRIVYGKFITNKENLNVNIPGVNFYPENEYEILLENDFIEKKKIKLTRKSYNDLELILPTDLPTGNYKTTMLINGKEQPQTGFEYGGYASLNYKSSAAQPILSVISKPSQKANSYCGFYNPAENLSRNEAIVANTNYTDSYKDKEFRLKLVNRQTNEDFILLKSAGPYGDACTAGMYYNDFKITDNIPNGDYEVYAMVGYFSEKDIPDISERYPRIISIK